MILCMKPVLIFLCAILMLPGIGFSQELGYQLPPEAITALVDAEGTPSVSIHSPTGRMLFIRQSELPDIADLAAPELRLAGLRIDPATWGPSRASYASSISLGTVDGKQAQEISGLPAQAHIRNLRWSADGAHIAFTHNEAGSISLWVVEVATAKARQLTSLQLNEVLGSAYVWMPDGHSLIVKARPENAGPPPDVNPVPKGPVVQENSGRKAAVRTFQDLLKNPADEDLFEYYATSVPYIVKLDGSSNIMAHKALYGELEPSPDGRYILATRYIRPFSYIVPYNRFAQTTELLDTEGNTLRILAELPVADNIPQGFDAVRKGIRSPQWRSDVPATLFWVEATDGGDPAAKAAVRDQLWFLKAPFSGMPVASVKLKMRFGGIQWGNGFALISEYWRKERLMRTSRFDPNTEEPELQTIFDRSYEDRYNDPGRFQTKANAAGFQVLLSDKKGKQLFMFGQGASAEGDRPFVDAFDLKTLKTRRLWRSEAPYYENPVAITDPDKLQFITRRESVTEQPNYFVRRLNKQQPRQITFFPDPMPALRKMQKELVRYQRNDSIPLSGTLYLPEGFKPGTDAPLPTLLWAYPNEYKNAGAAGQVSGSPYTFTRVGATSPILLVTQGYAVLNDASFPIVGEGSEEPNDTFIPQLVANAEAAIQKLVEMGVTDPDRVAVSGHSYGAFMTANLLTHCDLFAAGVARSGAYNRSLTPFGFQGEERTYWEAPELYDAMSPFMQANKMKHPLLLIHGAADDNSGTFTMQTERYYDALRGLGATTRMVLLPHESHGYRARQSVLHMHWEWVNWLDKYVKNKAVKN